MDLLQQVPLIGPLTRFVLSCIPCGSTVIGSHRVRVGTQFAEGGFSSVFLCTDLETGEQYALKLMIASEPDQIAKIHAEIRVHERFDHPHLLRLVDHSETVSNGRHTFRLLFPLYSAGSIGDVIVRMRSVGKIFSEDHALHLFAQVLEGVEAMHSVTPPLAHHDIKPENVLLTEDNKAVLMDFGSACRANYNTNDRKEAADLKDWAAEHCTMGYVYFVGSTLTRCV